MASNACKLAIDCEVGPQTPLKVKQSIACVLVEWGGALHIGSRTRGGERGGGEGGLWQMRCTPSGLPLTGTVSDSSFGWYLSGIHLAAAIIAFAFASSPAVGPSHDGKCRMRQPWGIRGQAEARVLVWPTENKFH